MSASAPPGERVAVVVPARLASARLPGKPLAEIAGEAMIVHVWRRAVEAGCGDVYVAVCDREVAAAVEAAGGRVCWTAPDLPSGSDRIAAAVAELDPQRTYGIVVNLQGDLPTIAPAQVRRCLAPLATAAVDIATLAAPLADDERKDPNVVKVIAELDEDTGIGRAQDFRRTLPQGESGPCYHHVGVYAYRRAALEAFVALPRSAREVSERLEQLRAMEAGMRIDVALVDSVPFGVDTPADLERARAVLTT